MEVGVASVLPINPIGPGHRFNVSNGVEPENVDRNWVIPSLCLALAILYVPLIIWGTWRDKRDDRMARLSVVSDKAQAQRSAYLITIITGWQFNSGTTSQVGIKLYGTIGSSEPIWLSNKKVRHFTTAAEDTFILLFKQKLGSLTSLELFHDNSGSSPSWYVSLVAVKNLLTLESWLFLFDQWLKKVHNALDESHLVSRKASPHEDVSVIRQPYQLGYYVRRLFRSSHMWFSIFYRPYGDTFTRPQRITCVFSALVHMMSFNTIYRESTVDTREVYIMNQVGGVHLSWSNVLIGIQSGLTCFVLDFFIDLLFRRSAPLDHTLPTYVKSKLKQLTVRVAVQGAKRAGTNVTPVESAVSLTSAATSRTSSLHSFSKKVSESVSSRLINFYSTPTDLDPVFQPIMVHPTLSVSTVSERASLHGLARGSSARSVLRLVTSRSQSSASVAGKFKVQQSREKEQTGADCERSGTSTAPARDNMPSMVTNINNKSSATVVGDLKHRTSKPPTAVAENLKLSTPKKSATDTKHGTRKSTTKKVNNDPKPGTSKSGAQVVKEVKSSTDKSGTGVVKDVTSSTSKPKVDKKADSSDKQQKLPRRGHPSSDTSSSIGKTSIASKRDGLNKNNHSIGGQTPKPLSSKPREYASYWFPSCCQYMAWMIPICSCSVCFYIMIAYSHSYDDGKSLQWVFSTLVSVFQSVTLIQPIKVLIAGFIYILILRDPMTSAHCLFFYRQLD